jgi:hypothetical protein
VVHRYTMDTWYTLKTLKNFNQPIEVKY